MVAFPLWLRRRQAVLLSKIFLLSLLLSFFPRALFCELLEGKIAFHRRLQDALLQVPEDGLPLKDFYRLLLPLVASVGDGHTFLLPPFIDLFLPFSQ